MKLEHRRIQVRIQNIGGVIPEYYSHLASGCDLRAHLEESITLQSLERRIIPTGLLIEIPAGYEAQIRPRSGQAAKKGLGMPNSPGTIDADYRGEVKVLVINLSSETISIEPGERIAQMVFAPVVQACFEEINEDLAASQRGGGGFGSTGTS